MNVERNFISDVVRSFYSSLKKDGKLCGISGVVPAVDVYGKHAYQKLYALKYIPAYYFEYCALAHDLDNRIHAYGYGHVKVVSFGCGLAPDYYALMHNLTCNFEFHGYDAYQWKQRNLMPVTGFNFNFHNVCVSTLNVSDVCDADVFVFPKSIGDIYDSDSENISHLADIISKTTKRRIFFLNSFVCTDGQQNIIHIGYFKKIHDALLNAGFTTNDNRLNTHYQGDEKGCGLNRVNRGFVYDANCFIKCDDPECKDKCRCNVIKSPILTNKFMDYQVMEYTR
jgi:hypothetical protein